MPKNEKIECNMYLDKDIVAKLDAMADVEKRSRSNMGNIILAKGLGGGSGPDYELQDAVKSNFEARALSLGMTPGEMLNSMLRESLGMMPQMEE